MTRDQIKEALAGAHGTNPDFRIQIRNSKLHWQRNGVACMTYEEWQRNAKASTPADNGRLSSAIFERRGARLVWLHLHETWLPPEVIAAGRYDF